MIDTPTRLERAAPSCLSSSACGCSASTPCPASWPELASAGLLPRRGSSAPSASSHTVPSAPVAKHSAEDQSCVRCLTGDHQRDLVTPPPAGAWCRSCCSPDPAAG